MDDTKKPMMALSFAEGAGAIPVRAPYAAAPAFDATKYWSYLETLEATDAEKAALLQTLWELMTRFVELGFGVDPVQTLVPVLVAASLADDAEGGGASPLAAGFHQANTGEGAGP